MQRVNVMGSFEDKLNVDFKWWTITCSNTTERNRKSAKNTWPGNMKDVALPVALRQLSKQMRHFFLILRGLKIEIRCSSTCPDATSGINLSLRTSTWLNHNRWLNSVFDRLQHWRQYNTTKSTLWAEKCSFNSFKSR